VPVGALHHPAKDVTQLVGNLFSRDSSVGKQVDTALPQFVTGPLTLNSHLGHDALIRSPIVVPVGKGCPERLEK
jgi:hypothetical protein